MRLDSSVFLCHDSRNLLSENSLNTSERPSPHRHDVAAAMLVDAALAVFVLFARSAAPHPVIPAELLGSLAIAVAYGTPAIAGWIARRGRPSLFVAAGLLATALSITSFSLVTLVLLPPALLFLGAAGGSRRSARTAAVGAILVLPVIVALLASGLFVVAWLAPIGLAVGSLVLLVRHAGAAGSRRASARVLGGTVLVMGLAALAWLLPITDTTTVCWASHGGSFTQTAEPDTAGGNGQISVGSGELGPGGSAGQGAAGGPGGTTIAGPVGSDGSSGCDGGVPAIEVSALSLVLSGACALTALVVIPRTPAVPNG